MSYIVLARKWRPLVFEDVVAQDHVTITLKNAISSGRIAHAYLFAGPRGVGKTTTARILAKAINCVDGPTPTPCNRCNFCEHITEGKSLDVLEIDGASNRGIDEIRDLREAVRYAPAEGRYKIYYIDEVHMLTEPAFNALLKTLEEPPRRVVFIFATTQPYKVPATIISRCQRFDFRRIPTSSIIERLAFIADQEGIRVDQDALFLIAKKADGSMRDAESLLDQVVSFGEFEISSQVVSNVLGLVDRDLLFQLTEAISSKDVKKGIDLIDRVIDEGVDPGEFLDGLIEHLRNLLFTKIEGGIKSVEASELDKARYEKVSPDFSEEDLLRMINILSDLGLTINRSPQPRLRLELAIVKLIKLESTVRLGELLERLSMLERGLSSPNRMEGGGKPQLQARAPIESQATFENLRDNWQAVVDRVKKRKISLGTFLAEGTPEGLSGDVLCLSFKRENAFHMSQVGRNRKMVEEVLAEIFADGVKLECILEEDEGKARRASEKESPALQDVLEVFEGELVKE